MTANQAFRSKAAVGIALLALSSGVLAGATLTGAGAADRVKPPRSCMTAIHDYQKSLHGAIQIMTEAGKYIPLIGMAAEAVQTDTAALTTEVIAKEKTITTKVKSDGSAVSAVERKAVAAADKCEKGRGR